MNKKQIVSMLAPATWSASIIPIIVATLYSIYKESSFDIFIFIALIFSAVGAQCFANILNDYSDYKSGLDNSDTIFGPEGSIIVSDDVPLSEVKLLGIKVLLFLILPVTYLTLKVGISILIVGLFGLSIAYLYSAGPLPLSTTPFGELCSGIVMGTFITGISYFALTNTINLSILLVSFPVILWISTMTFTNSICDMERDKRFRTTLALYLGKEKAIKLLKFFYIGMYLFVLMGVLVKVLPITLVLISFSFPVVWKRLNQINTKNTTIQNKYPIMGLSCGSGIIFFKTYFILMLIGIISNYI